MGRRIILFLTLYIASLNTRAQTAGELQIQDTRSTNLMPNEFTWGTPFSLRARVDFKIRSLIGLPGLGYYSTLLSLPQWPDNSGDKIHQLGFGNSGIFFRQAWPMATSWESWRKLLIEDENGKVGIGIGVDNPLSVLDVKGTVRFGIHRNWWIRDNAGGTQFALGNTTSEDDSNIKLSINNVGNVGIGTSQPSEPLHIVAGSGNVLRLHKAVGGGSGSLIMSTDFGSGNTYSISPYINGISNGGFSIKDITNNVERMVIQYMTGNVGIGTTNPSERLSVNGNIRTKKLIVTQTGWPDYVFVNDYYLMPLNDVKKFINKNKHLPGIPSAEQVTEAGLDVGDTQALLLKKIEELTLYVIQLKEENQAIKKEIQQFKNKR